MASARRTVMAMSLVGVCVGFMPRPSVLLRCGSLRVMSEQPETEPDVSDFYASLRSRAREVEAESDATLERWRTGKCVSRVAVRASDWVRRMAYDAGFVAFGTSSGCVGISRVGVGGGESPALVPAHARIVEAQDLTALHGAYDGGPHKCTSTLSSG